MLILYKINMGQPARSKKFYNIVKLDVENIIMDLLTLSPGRQAMSCKVGGVDLLRLIVIKHILFI